jgi:hypothetical protein
MDSVRYWWIGKEDIIHPVLIYLLLWWAAFLGVP